jgi:hypothetical protein
MRKEGAGNCATGTAATSRCTCGAARAASASAAGTTTGRPAFVD